MRGPILNISPGLGASGVDMEYRRNSQGTIPSSVRSSATEIRCPRAISFPFYRLFTSPQIRLLNILPSHVSMIELAKTPLTGVIFIARNSLQ